MQCSHSLCSSARCWSVALSAGVIPVLSRTGEAHVASIQRKSKGEQKGFIGVARVGAAEGNAPSKVVVEDRPRR